MQHTCSTAVKKIPKYFDTKFHALFAGNDGFVFRCSNEMVSGGYLLGKQLTCQFSTWLCCLHTFCCEIPF